MTTEQQAHTSAPDESTNAQPSGPIPPNRAKAKEPERHEANVQPLEPELVDESPEAAEPSDPSAEAELSALAAELEAANRRAEENFEKVLRTQADMENVRRRAQRDVENAHKFALEKFAKELLGVVDSLEMGLSAAQAEDASVEKIREGTELTLQLLQKALEKFSVAPVNPEGQAFDPERHQAVSMQPVEGVKSNTVTAVLQKGYTLNDRLIRPAMVMVAK